MKTTINLSKISMAFIVCAIVSTLNIQSVMAQKKINQTAGHNVLGEFAPQFAELNDKVLFGEDVWNDNTLSLHDRSMVTISILKGKGILVIIDGADHTDLYDNLEKIPFDRIDSFFKTNLTK